MSFTIMPNSSDGIRVYPGPKVELNDQNVDSIRQEYLESNSDGIILNVSNFAALENSIFEDIEYLLVRKKVDLVAIQRAFPNIKCLILNEIGKSFLLDDINKFLHLHVLGLLNCKYQISELIQRVRKLSISHQNLIDGPLKYFSSLEELILGSTRNSNLGGLEYLLNLRYLYYGWAKNDSSHLNQLGELLNIQGITLFRASQLICFPSMAKCLNLKVVCIEESNKLKDLSGLYDAPNLDTLYILGCNSLKPESFFPFRKHPTLKQLYWGSNPNDQEKVRSKLGDKWNPEMVNMEYVLPEIT